MQYKEIATGLHNSNINKQDIWDNCLKFLTNTICHIEIIKEIEVRTWGFSLVFFF